MTDKEQKSAEVARTHSAVEQKSTEVLELIDAYAEARHRQGHSTYNAATAAARQAVVDALGGVQALSAAPAVDIATVGELQAFEAWIKKDGGDLSIFGTPPNMHYQNSAVNNAWVAWKARAALAAQGGK